MKSLNEADERPSTNIKLSGDAESSGIGGVADSSSTNTGTTVKLNGRKTVGKPREMLDIEDSKVDKTQSEDSRLRNYFFEELIKIAETPLEYTSHSKEEKYYDSKVGKNNNKDVNVHKNKKRERKVPKNASSHTKVYKKKGVSTNNSTDTTIYNSETGRKPAQTKNDKKVTKINRSNKKQASISRSLGNTVSFLSGVIDAKNDLENDKCVDKPCFNFQKNGKCSYGDRCKFSHVISTSDSSTVPSLDVPITPTKVPDPFNTGDPTCLSRKGVDYKMLALPQIEMPLRKPPGMKFYVGTLLLLILSAVLVFSLTGLERLVTVNPCSSIEFANYYLGAQGAIPTIYIVDECMFTAPYLHSDMLRAQNTINNTDFSDLFRNASFGFTTEEGKYMYAWFVINPEDGSDVLIAGSSELMNHLEDYSTPDKNYQKIIKSLKGTHPIFGVESFIMDYRILNIYKLAIPPIWHTSIVVLSYITLFILTFLFVNHRARASPQVYPYLILKLSRDAIDDRADLAIKSTQLKTDSLTYYELYYNYSCEENHVHSAQCLIKMTDYQVSMCSIPDGFKLLNRKPYFYNMCQELTRCCGKPLKGTKYKNGIYLNRATIQNLNLGKYQFGRDGGNIAIERAIRDQERNLTLSSFETQKCVEGYNTIKLATLLVMTIYQGKWFDPANF